MSDLPLYIHGHSAVSPVGLDSQSLYRACLEKADLPVEMVERTQGEKSISYANRPVDTAALRAVMPKHARIRRSSNVTKFAVTVAHQALGAERIERIKNRELNIGIVLTFLNGCVNYSNRFFGEVLEDPKFASPILFPETVFNAPASHVAASLNCDGPVYTLIGDSTSWFSAIEIADGWIADGLVDGCLVLCAEEIDWLTLEGLRLYSRDLIATEGAAAIYLEATRSEVCLEKFCGPFSYHDSAQRRTAMRDAWAPHEALSNDILIGGLMGAARLDRDEIATTAAWSGAQLNPARTLGEGMGIRCGFQTIAAIEALRDGYDSATIFAAGGNQYAYSARLTRPHS